MTRQYGLELIASRKRALRVAKLASDGARHRRSPRVPGKILPTFCLLSVTGSSRIMADTITGNPYKIDTSRRPRSSMGVRTTNSRKQGFESLRERPRHGRNRDD